MPQQYKLHELARIAISEGRPALALGVTMRLCNRHGLNWPGVIEWLEAHGLPVAEFTELVTERETP